MKIFKAISMLFVLLSMFFVSVAAYEYNLQNVINQTWASVPQPIEVRVDGDLMDLYGVNRVSFERGDRIDIEVRLTSLVNLSNVEIMAMINGYEFNKMEPMTDTTDIFDMEANVTYKKKLSLKVPILVEEDSYKLRILVSDRYSTLATYEYRLKIDASRRGMMVKDVIFSPGSVVEAGRVLLTTVRVQNMGKKTEETVKVTVAIPELGISASDFIDKVTAGDSETSEEMYMRIPACAKPGDYNAVIEVKYNELREAIYEKALITVVKGEQCPVASDSSESKEKELPKTVIALGATSQEVVKGKAGALYPLTITNNGPNAKGYTVSVEGTNDFASVQINPVSTFVLNKGESQAVFVYLTANNDAVPGQRVFTVTVKSGEEVLKQIPLTAVVSAEKQAPSSSINLKTALEVSLIALVVILVILALIVVFSKMKKDDGKEEDEEEVEGKTYY